MTNVAFISVGLGLLAVALSWFVMPLTVLTIAVGVVRALRGKSSQLTS